MGYWSMLIGDQSSECAHCVRNVEHRTLNTVPGNNYGATSFMIAVLLHFEGRFQERFGTEGNGRTKTWLTKEMAIAPDLFVAHLFVPFLTRTRKPEHEAACQL
jgi:hypothetical protein